MRDNTVHVRRGKKHPSRMEMIVLAALAALMVSGGTLLLLGSFAGTGYYRLEPQGSNYSRTFSCRSCVGMVNQGKPLDISVG